MITFQKSEKTEESNATFETKTCVEGSIYNAIDDNDNKVIGRNNSFGEVNNNKITLLALKLGKGRQ